MLIISEHALNFKRCFITGGRNVSAPSKVGPLRRSLWKRPLPFLPKRGGAEGATGPGNSQANGPQEDGSLESGGASRAAHRRSKPAPRCSANLSGLRTEGVANGAVLASGQRDSVETVLSEPTAGPLKRTPLHDAAPGTGRAPRALRRLRDAGAVPDRHPGRACPDPHGGRPVRRLAHGAGAADRASPGRTPPRRSRRWCRATSRACSPASSATPSSPTTAAASSTI